MLNGPNIGYTPSVAYQGGQQQPLNAPDQEPRTGETQPREAAAADTQRSNEQSVGDDAQRQQAGGRGSRLDVQA